MIATDNASFVEHEDAAASALPVRAPTHGELAPPELSEEFRAICCGEALSAISRYVSDDLVSPPDAETLRFLGDALVRMAAERRDFGPEDFALYAMSVLHHDCDGEDVQRIRRGAMRYLLDVLPRLSPEFQSLEEDARAFLRQVREPVPWQGASNTERVPPRPARQLQNDEPSPYRRMTLSVTQSEIKAGPSPRQRGSVGARKETRGLFVLVFFGVLVVSAVYASLLLSLSD